MAQRLDKRRLEKGVVTNPAEGEVFAPPAIWVAAVNLVLDQLVKAGVDFGQMLSSGSSDEYVNYSSLASSWYSSSVAAHQHRSPHYSNAPLQTPHLSNPAQKHRRRSDPTSSSGFNTLAEEGRHEVQAQHQC